MLRILIELIMIQVTMQFGYPLTKEDKRIVSRHAYDEAVKLEKQIYEIAHKIYKERIYIRHGRKKPAYPLHPGYGSERKLQRGSGDDGLGPDEE